VTPAQVPAQRWMIHPWNAPDKAGSLSVDVAIVGAGASGLYCAYRLATAAGDFARTRVAVFEASHRVGGRVNSVEIPGTTLVADLGAMRYLPSQAIINSLVDHFHLDPYEHDFRQHGFFVRGRDIIPPPDKASKGGVRRRAAQLLERQPQTGTSPRTASKYKIVNQTGYRWLRPDEVGLAPGELVALGIAKAFAAIDLEASYAEVDKFLIIGPRRTFQRKIRRAAKRRHTLRFGYFTPLEWQAIKQHTTFHQQPLFRIGFWDLVQSSLSNEAFKLVEDGLGYHSIIGTWNAAEAVPWFLADFSVDRYLSLMGGMSRLIECLLNGFIEASNDAWDRAVGRHELIHLGHILKMLSKVDTAVPGESLYKLEFDCHDAKSAEAPEAYSGRFTGTQRTVYAKQVVLALPKGALRGLQFGGIGQKETAEFHAMMEAVTAHPLVKIFSVYSKPWWSECRSALRHARCRNAFVSNGRGPFATCKLFTDLPLRMLYYHGPECRQSKGGGGSTPRSGHTMIMAYCDARHAAYWDSLNRLKVHRFCPVWNKLSELEQEVVLRYGVSDLFEQRFREQLDRYHERYESGKGRSQPELILYMNWAHAPYHGGWHSWNLVRDPGLTPANVRSRMRQPFPEEAIYVCGEAFSQDQGWIEGALRTAEAVLGPSGLRIPGPPWGHLRSFFGPEKYVDLEDYVSW
jgi:hypothetical protein